jgi:hypothetical protein
MGSIDHSKVNQRRIEIIKADKEHKGVRAPDAPGIERLYEIAQDNNLVHSALQLWEIHDISTEQILVKLVDALVAQNKEYHDQVVHLLTTSTTPSIWLERS